MFKTTHNTEIGFATLIGDCAVDYCGLNKSDAGVNGNMCSNNNILKTVEGKAVKRNYHESEGGFATLIALIMVAMLTLIGLAALSTSDDEITIAGNELQETRAFYAAEAGLEIAAADLQVSHDSIGLNIVSLPQGEDTLNNCILRFSTSDDGPASHEVLSNGTLAGLHAFVKSYTITSTGINRTDRGRVQVSQSFEAAMVPLFQFAVFYENDLEIAPGPAMELSGRVHTNGDLWLQAGESLSMDSYVTAFGDIFHGRKGGGGVSDAEVRIKDASGNYVSMRDGSEWLDADDAYWYDSSITRWDGRVQDATHGQARLEVPLGNSGGDPHKIIEPATGNPDSYENKADLKFIDGQAYKLVGGVWDNITTDLVNDGVMTRSSDQFYDGRESEWVDVTELDMSQLYTQGYAPANGVIYFSDQTEDFPALRLANASEIGDALTIASENPVYTYGNFNSDNKKPAAIMADAVNFLSSAWQDTSSSLDKSNRQAVPTTVNASIMSGNIETTDADYNGGFENLPRFLEDWTDRKFTWSGSMVALWYSQQATSTWNGTYYTPPLRDWSYDPDLDDPANHPPETPSVQVFQRTGWKQEYVGYDNTDM